MANLGGVGAVAFVAAASSVLAACTGTSPYVSGRITQSPGCGVVLPDEPVCPDRPVDGEVQFRRADGTVAARVRTQADGRYVVMVPVGQYTLVVDPEGDGPWPNCSETPTVEVRRGRANSFDLTCGSGIR